MKILIVGYSKIVQNRVLPALAKMPEVTGIDIASRSNAGAVAAAKHRFQGVFDDYAAAFSHSGADLAYISTINSTHGALVEQALQRGMHVIVDKPACTSFDESRRMIDLARRKKLCLAEATVYAYHAQIGLIRGAFREAQSSPTRLTAVFSFPPLEQDNFRYRKELGGGALLDLGPYAVSVARVFFDNAQLLDMSCTVVSRGGTDNLETAFSMTALYSHGRSMVGHFGFDTGYRNTVNLLGPGMSADIHRIFTTPADMVNEIKVQHNNTASVVPVPACDNFLMFLNQVAAAIKKGDHSAFVSDMEYDAHALHVLRSSAQEA
ncbi:MAG TPA: Gfo/Idh/MocA family oxidoreductase [Candidatus Omnitrophota bacterium]|nr:Gfo/Idh/MocA family oxidoreductase [Candidatus Omnitrophota bacterium]